MRRPSQWKQIYGRDGSLSQSKQRRMTTLVQRDQDERRKRDVARNEAFKKAGLYYAVPATATSVTKCTGRWRACGREMENGQQLQWQQGQQQQQQ